MPAYKLMIEVLKNGQFFMKADAATLGEYFDMCTSNIARKAAIGGVIHLNGNKYMLRYNGEKVPRVNPHEKKPAQRRKPKMSMKDTVAAARKAGMSYGMYVGLMERS